MSDLQSLLNNLNCWLNRGNNECFKINCEDCSHYTGEGFNDKELMSRCIKIVEAMLTGDLISRKALLAEYDRQHQGPSGRARKLIEDAPTAIAAEPGQIRCDSCRYAVNVTDDDGKILRWCSHGFLTLYFYDILPESGEAPLKCPLRNEVRRKKTIFERIKEMTIEEIEKHIVNPCDNFACSECMWKFDGVCVAHCSDDIAIRWLKSEWK